MRAGEPRQVALAATGLTVLCVWGLFAGLLQLRIPSGLLISLLSSPTG